MLRLYLVSRVAKKAAARTPAAEICRSTWFLKARAFVERKRTRWRILSSEHGLAEPSEIVVPYEKTVNRMTAQKRLAWGDRAVLVPVLRARGILVSIPMTGLTIFRQLAWLGGAGA